MPGQGMILVQGYFGIFNRHYHELDRLTEVVPKN